jgi:carbamoyltransferase
MYEEALFHLLQARQKIDAVSIAGGCGMNSVANGKVTMRSLFKHVYVKSAAGGCRRRHWRGIRGVARPGRRTRPGYGPCISGACGRRGRDKELLVAPQGRSQRLAAPSSASTTRPELCQRTVAAIADVQVVDWFEGRMEWVQRALGNRSIVCELEAT